MRERSSIVLRPTASIHEAAEKSDQSSPLRSPVYMYSLAHGDCPCLLSLSVTSTALCFVVGGRWPNWEGAAVDLLCMRWQRRCICYTSIKRRVYKASVGYYDGHTDLILVRGNITATRCALGCPGCWRRLKG